jgi:DNA-binding CsgD family transcriptional regulator/PAS domain-containing protein
MRRFPPAFVVVNGTHRRRSHLFEVDESRLAAAIDRFYEAAVSPEMWPAALDEFSAALGGIGGLLFYFPQGSTPWSGHSASLGDSIRAFFEEGWHSQNVRTTRGRQALSQGLTVFSEEQIFEPGELDRQPIQSEFFKRYGLRSFVGFDVVPNKVLASVERGHRPFQEWELKTIARAHPHLTRAGAFSLARGNAHSHGMLDALSLVSCAAVLIDPEGCIIRMNEAAEQLWQSAFTLSKKRLVPRHVGSRQAFATLIEAAISPIRPHEGPSRSHLAIPRATARPVFVQAMPIAGSGQDMFQLAKALVLISDPESKNAETLNQIQQYFSLTPAEARIAEQLAQGIDLGSICAELCVTMATGRTHLQSIFHKTSTSRQGELVALLNRLTTTPMP